MNLNFYADHHGKSPRDTHFSNVSHFVHEHSLKKQLVSSNDIVEAINLGQIRANQNS